MSYGKHKPEEIDFLREYYPGHSAKETWKAFNEHFGTNYTLAQVTGRIYKNKIRHDETFKRDYSYLQAPVGSIYLHRGRYEVKIAEPNVWVIRSRYVWEQHYGKLKDDEVIIHLDGDKANDNIDNLYPVNNRILAKLNRNQFKLKGREISINEINRQKLLLKIADLERELGYERKHRKTEAGEDM